MALILLSLCMLAGISLYGMELREVASASTIHVVCNDTNSSEFTVSRSMLEISRLLKGTLDLIYKESGVYPEQFPVDLSAEEFKNLLSLLELAVQEEKIKEILDTKSIFKLAQVIELANKYDISALLEYGIPILAEKLKRPEELERYVHNENYVPSLELSSEMQAAIAGELTNNNPERLTILRQIPIPESRWDTSAYVHSISWSPDSKWLASVSADKTIRIWNVVTGECVHLLKNANKWVGAISWSPDSKWLVSGCSDTAIRIWDMETGECVRILKGHSSSIYSVSWSPDGKWIASASADKTIRIWNAVTGECVRTSEWNSNWTYSVCWSPDSTWLASGSNDNAIRIWGAQNEQCVRILKGHSDSVRSICWSPDSKWVASGSDDNTIRIWSATTGECVQILKGHSNWVMKVNWSPDSKWVASGADDKTIRIWDKGTGSCVRILEGHSEPIRSISWSPDSKWVASGAADSTIRIWDATTGNCVRILKGHNSWITKVSWSPDGKWVASRCAVKMIFIWDMRDLLHAASELQNLDLRQALFLEYLHSHAAPRESMSDYCIKIFNSIPDIIKNSSPLLAGLASMVAGYMSTHATITDSH